MQQSLRTAAERLATGTAFVLSFLVIGKFVGIVQSILLARLLGPRDYGVLSILLQILDLAILFAALGLPVAVTKFVAEHRARNGPPAVGPITTAFTTCLITSVCMSALVFVLSNPLAYFVYRTPELSQYLAIAAFSLPFSVLVILSFSTVQGYQRIADFAKYNVFLTLLSLVVLVAFTWRLRLFGTSLGITVMSVISVSAAAIMLKQVTGSIRAISRISGAVWREHVLSMLRFSIPLLVSSGLLFTAHLFTKTYLAVSRGYADLGLFRVAESMSQLLTFIPTSLSVPLLPILAEFNAVNPDKMKVAVSKTLKFTAIVTVLAALYLGLPAPFSIELLLGGNYVNAEVIKALSILLTLAALNSVVVVLGNVFLGSGRTWVYTKLLLVNIVPYVVLAPIFINWFGLLGLSVAWLVSYAVYAVAMVHACREQLTRNAYAWILLPFLLMSLYPVAFVSWDYSYLVVSVVTIGLSTSLALRALVRDVGFVVAVRAILSKRHGHVRNLCEILLNGVLKVVA